MGFVTLGIFTFTKQGIEGSMFQMISHGLISAALFLCVGVLYDRLHSRLIVSYGGVVNFLPKFSFILFKPGFPLPARKTSFPSIKRTIKYPEGIDPITQNKIPNNK